MSTLQIGNTTRINIDARKPWNDSGVDLNAGGRYQFAVLTGQMWKDASIECGADGYPSPLLLRAFEAFRRVPGENYFKLIGAIGRSLEVPIIIGGNLQDFLAFKSGRLYRFANDIIVMYWNNCGSIGLNVTRKA